MLPPSYNIFLLIHQSISCNNQSGLSASDFGFIQHIIIPFHYRYLFFSFSSQWCLPAWSPKTTFSQPAGRVSLYSVVFPECSWAFFVQINRPDKEKVLGLLGSLLYFRTEPASIASSQPPPYFTQLLNHIPLVW